MVKTKGRLNKSEWLHVCFDKVIYELELLSDERSITDEDYNKICRMQEQLESLKRKY
jgi:hypothetical protein